MSSTNPIRLSLYTDGSCNTHTRCGGIGVVALNTDTAEEVFRFSAPFTDTTTNDMELRAIAAALLLTWLARSRIKSVTVNSDSSYSIHAVRDWARKWIENDWLTSTMQPVKNRGRIKTVMARRDRLEAFGIRVRFRIIKGHSGIYGNEEADQLAVAARRSLEVSLGVSRDKKR